MKTRIAIIGAGFRGIGCLRELVEKGYDVDLYEKNDDIGGTWHPANTYDGMRIHTPAYLNQFFDFPFPQDINILERLESKQIFQYLRSYAQHFKLYQHIHCNQPVHKIIYNSHSKKSKLLINSQLTDEYDYVINTHGFTDRNIPEFNGADKFKGQIVHSFSANVEFVNSIINAKKNVTILGGSKTATDMILAFNRHHYPVNWLYRKSYWFIRYNCLLEKCVSKPNGKKGNFLYKNIFLSALVFSDKAPHLLITLNRAINMIDTYGDRHNDYKKFHAGVVDDDQFAILRRYNQEGGITGEVDYFDENGIYLTNGRYFKTDVVICCTGSSGGKSLVDIEIDGNRLDYETIYDVYRGRVIPQIPNLIFTAFHTFTLSLTEGLIEGEVVNKYIQLHPNTDYLNKNATHYTYPYFTRMNVFDSKNYFLGTMDEITNEYIKHHEISPMELLRWQRRWLFEPEEPNKTFEIKLPD